MLKRDIYNKQLEIVKQLDTICNKHAIKYYANADVRMKQDAVEKATSDFNPIISSAVDFTFDNDDVVFKRLYGLM